MASSWSEEPSAERFRLPLQKFMTEGHGPGTGELEPGNK